MPILTEEQRDDLHVQNAASLKRQADAAEASLREVQGAAKELLTAKQEAAAMLFRDCLNARKTSLTTATTDDTLRDIALDAMKMTEAVWPQYRALLGFA